VSWRTRHAIAQVEGWEALAKKHGFSLPQVAFNFAFLPAIVECAPIRAYPHHPQRAAHNGERGASQTGGAGASSAIMVLAA
jgi:hypothetical protein